MTITTKTIVVATIAGLTITYGLGVAILTAPVPSMLLLKQARAVLSSAHPAASTQKKEQEQPK